MNSETKRPVLIEAAISAGEPKLQTRAADPTGGSSRAEVFQSTSAIFICSIAIAVSKSPAKDHVLESFNQEISGWLNDHKPGDPLVYLRLRELISDFREVVEYLSDPERRRDFQDRL